MKSKYWSIPVGLVSWQNNTFPVILLTDSLSKRGNEYWVSLRVSKRFCWWNLMPSLVRIIWLLNGPTGIFSRNPVDLYQITLKQLILKQMQLLIPLINQVFGIYSPGRCGYRTARLIASRSEKLSPFIWEEKIFFKSSQLWIVMMWHAVLHHYDLLRHEAFDAHWGQLASLN